jgi:hypothetical protein
MFTVPLFVNGEKRRNNTHYTLQLILQRFNILKDKIVQYTGMNPMDQ